MNGSFLKGLIIVTVQHPFISWQKFIPASSRQSHACMTLTNAREGRIPRPLGRFKFDASLLAAGYLTFNSETELLHIISLHGRFSN